jgi:hypothetical protein
MDGITGCTPYAKPSIEMKKLIATINAHNSKVMSELTIPQEFCRIMDWDENKVTTYVEVYAEALRR